MSRLHDAKWSLLEFGYRCYVGASMSLLSRVPYGTNVYDRDWDVLVLLDTCRVDAMRAVAPEYDFVSDVESMTSVGSTSSTWIAKTFAERYRSEIANTVYVSANPHTERVLVDREFPEREKGAYFGWTDWDTVGIDAFRHVDQPWKYCADERFDQTPPEDVTDRTIALHREYDPDRMIVHYMQPHRPHVANAIREDRDLTPAEADPFGYLKDGGDRETVWENHVDELRYVLDSVATLRENVDAETVAISADHGDGFGEWGCYAHIAGDPRPQVRQVPWVLTSGTDSGEYEPHVEPASASTSTDDQLRALGYK